MSQQSNEIFFKIAKVISEQLNIDEKEVLENKTFDNLNADSLDQVQILMKVEDLFNIEISDEDFSKVICIKDLVNCVNKSLGK